MMLTAFAALFAAVAGLLVVVQHSGVSPAAIDASYLCLGLAAAAAIAVWGRSQARNAAGGDVVPAALGGLALATDTLSAAFFVGLAGAIFTWGHDGLAFGLGLGAGCLLLQLLVAPRLPSSGARSLPEYFALRFPGRTPQMVAGLVVVLSMTLLLVAQLMAGGLVIARMLGIDAAAAISAAAIAMFACFVLRGSGAPGWAKGALFPVLLAAFLVPLVVLSADWYGLPLPQLAYGNALWQIQSLEETLLEQDLADPGVLKPMLTPFLSLNAPNFFGVVLGIAVGTASLPSLLSRHFAMPSAHAARVSSVWALVFVALFLSAVPALAAYARLALLTLIGDHTSLADLPAWLFTYGKLGLVEICGRMATDAAAVTEACAALPDASAVLRLQDLTLDPDMIVLAMAEIVGLDAAMFGLIAAAALAAALVSAGGPLNVIAQVLGCGADAERAKLGRLTPWVAAALALVVAALVAVARPANMLTVATWAFTLAAAGLFPALVAGLWWRRANAYGAAAAMLVGLAVAVFYLVGTRYFAVAFFEVWGSLSSAGPTAREIFGELNEAWIAAAPGAPKDAAWAALEAHAQTIANLWGTNGLATALLALPAAIVALVVVSLAMPTERRGALTMPRPGIGTGTLS